jgi:hypothetical protein
LFRLKSQPTHHLQKRERGRKRESYSDFGGFTRDGESNRHDSEKTHYSTHNLYPSLHFSFPLSPSFCSCEEVERVLTQNGNYGFLVSSLPILLIFLIKEITTWSWSLLQFTEKFSDKSKPYISFEQPRSINRDMNFPYRPTCPSCVFPCSTQFPYEPSK